MEIHCLAISSLAIFSTIYVLLLTEKFNKFIVTGIGASLIILLNVFDTKDYTNSKLFNILTHNLDLLGFIIGMLILVGIVRESGIFEAIAIWFIKLTKGNPRILLLATAASTLILTIFLSNIPTVIILSPILIIFTRQLRLPHFPYFFAMIVMANLGGAATPLSDPTTYYQAKIAALSFSEVFLNSGLIIGVLAIVSTFYIYLIFRKDLQTTVEAKELSGFNPNLAIKNKKILKVGLPILIITLLLIIFKEFIFTTLKFRINDAALLLMAGLICMQIFKLEPKKLLKEYIDWEIIFFLISLFIVTSSLEFTGVIDNLGLFITSLTGQNISLLLLFVTLLSALLSIFINNVSYNIAMIGIVLAMGRNGILVYPLWWALNLGISIGGMGSPISAACNIIALEQAEKEHLHIPFFRYLLVAVPLVVINALITFGILWLKYK